MDESVVPDEPSSVLLCRYFGLNAGDVLDNPIAANVPAGDPANRSWSRSGELAFARELGTAERVALVDALRGPGIGGTQGGVSNCPAATGALAVVILRYDNAAPVAVSIELDGCRSVSNGSFHLRSAMAGDAAASLGP
ncbi:hypothetical protein GIS00_02545 [Nakamurella sp. YIM 132087]|uniref:Uncharacterized protein n=1 Tax=Nakamurella alba TaxID=2665158 RepID=A0A7K1FIV2_9ACTN|nr:hypothetical protein [Nakamurella alba]MTD12824.1 hypothetical protein [Nakamurella alba]